MTTKKYFASLMAFIILLSSLGATGYERYCDCTGEVFKSVFFKSKSDCCSHTKSQKTKSCCSVKKHKSQEGEFSIKANKCCDTKVTYNHYDGETPIDYQSESFADQCIIPATKAQNFSVINFERICPNKLLQLRFNFTDLSPPFYLSGREILRKIQIIRC
jgi:hypothetical protein